MIDWFVYGILRMPQCYVALRHLLCLRASPRDRHALAAAREINEFMINLRQSAVLLHILQHKMSFSHLHKRARSII